MTDDEREAACRERVIRQSSLDISAFAKALEMAAKAIKDAQAEEAAKSAKDK